MVDFGKVQLSIIGPPSGIIGPVSVPFSTVLIRNAEAGLPPVALIFGRLIKNAASVLPLLVPFLFMTRKVQLRGLSEFPDRPLTVTFPGSHDLVPASRTTGQRSFTSLPLLPPLGLQMPP